MKDKVELSWIEIACPCCGSIGNYEVLFRDRNRRELIPVETNCVKCKNCTMVYLTPIPEPDSFNKNYEEIYLKFMKEGEEVEKETKESIIYKSLERFLGFQQKTFLLIKGSWIKKEFVKKEKLKFLDIGCSNAMKIKWLEDLKYHIHGIDVNPSGIEEAIKNIPDGDFRIGLLNEGNFEDSFFDIVHMDNVFEHIHDPANLLSEINRILKKDGKLILIIPSLSTIQRLWGKYYTVQWIPFHVALYTRTTIKLLLERNNFRVRKIYNQSIAWWAILSYRQWSYRNSNKNIDYKKTSTTLIAEIFLNPVFFLLEILGNADCLVVIAEKKTI